MFAHLKSGRRALCGVLFLLCLPLAGAQGSETVLKSFTFAPLYGKYPIGQLAVSGSAFYGVTQDGLYGYGNIYKMLQIGGISVFHEFAGPDGQTPAAGLVRVGSSLYGSIFCAECGARMALLECC